MSAPNERETFVHGNAAPRRALEADPVAVALEQLAAEMQPPARYCRSEQGREGLLWTVYEGEPGDFVTGRRIAFFVREEDARAFLYGAPSPAIRSVDPQTLDRIEGDARGVFVFLRLDRGVDGLGPCLVLHPAVVEAIHAQLTRRRT